MTWKRIGLVSVAIATLAAVPLAAPAAPILAASGCPITLAPSVWKPDPSSMGWSPVAFTPTGPLSFTLGAKGKPGYGGMTTTVDVNLTQDPYLVIDVVKLSGGAEWNIRGTHNLTLISPNNSTTTGVQTFNMARALKLSGKQKLPLYVSENTVPGVLTVGYIKIQSSASGCTSTTPTTKASGTTTHTSGLPKTGEGPWLPASGALLVAAGAFLGLRRHRHAGGRAH